MCLKKERRWGHPESQQIRENEDKLRRAERILQQTRMAPPGLWQVKMYFLMSSGRRALGKLSHFHLTPFLMACN